jgi:ABC-type sugar transport system permease subunit
MTDSGTKIHTELEPAAAARRRQHPAPRRSVWLKGLGGWIWIAPVGALVLLLKLYPLALIARDSLTDRTFFTPGQFVGLDNFSLLLGNATFYTAVKNNFILCLSVPLTIVIALSLSGTLYRGILGSRTLESLIFLPFVPAVAAVSVVFLFVLGPEGPLNSLLLVFGLGDLARPWLTDPTFAIWAVMVIMTWKRLGFILLLFTARLLSLDEELLDAAAVDGASWSAAFWRIAVPQMGSVVVLAAVLGFIDVFSYGFAYIFILTQGGPGTASYTLEFLLYQTQFNRQALGQASAIAVVLLAFVGAIAYLCAVFARRERD